MVLWQAAVFCPWQVISLSFLWGCLVKAPGFVVAECGCHGKTCSHSWNVCRGTNCNFRDLVAKSAWRHSLHLFVIVLRTDKERKEIRRGSKGRDIMYGFYFQRSLREKQKEMFTGEKPLYCSNNNKQGRPIVQYDLLLSHYMMFYWLNSYIEILLLIILI